MPVLAYQHTHYPNGSCNVGPYSGTSPGTIYLQITSPPQLPHHFNAGLKAEMIYIFNTKIKTGVMASPYNSNMSLNQWPHTLFIWDDQHGTCYLNGDTLGLKVMAASLRGGPSPLLTGYRNQQGGDNHYRFEGYMA
jgi:hypothetical protein